MRSREAYLQSINQPTNPQGLLGLGLWLWRCPTLKEPLLVLVALVEDIRVEFVCATLHKPQLSLQLREPLVLLDIRQGICKRRVCMQGGRKQSSRPVGWGQLRHKRQISANAQGSEVVLDLGSLLVERVGPAILFFGFEHKVGGDPESPQEAC